MKSALLLKVLSFFIAGGILVGGGVLAGMTLAPQREAANLIPTPVLGNPVEPIQSAPVNNNMNMNTAVSPQPPATGTSGNQMGATPNAMPSGQPGYGMQGNGSMGMGDNWEMNGRDNWGMGNDMPGNNNAGMGMGGNWGMGNGMNGQGYTASLAVTTPDEAARAAQAYLAGLNNPDLVLGEIMPYGEDYYARIYQQSSDQVAFSLMVDAGNGQVWSVNGGQ